MKNTIFEKCPPLQANNESQRTPDAPAPAAAHVSSATTATIHSLSPGGLRELPQRETSAAPPPSSTGPRTPSGKAISSQNARKHDLCSKTLRLSPEDWAEYSDMHERYTRDLQPADNVEHTLVDEICFNYWRLQQAREIELQVILEHPTELAIISLYIRYRTGYERAFYKALDKIHQTQRIRKQKADAVRSAKPEPAPLSGAEAAANPIPAPAVRSVDSESTKAAALADQLEDHILENRVRGELALPPLQTPKPLLDQLKAFVSQNRCAVPDRLLELMRRANLE